MTREEILKAIENGDRVWVLDKDLKRVIPYNANSIIVNNFNADALGYNFEDLYKTKAEAEHYLHHANISRTEHLPFLTWEEFLKSREIIFTTKKYETVMLGILNNKLILTIRGKSSYNYWDLTEANFYKAYDECVRLFRGEE